MPLSDFGLGRHVLSSREGSCGPLSSVELRLSFGRGLGRISSSELAFNSSLIGSDGVESGESYHDADLSKTTSRLTQTAQVEGVKHLNGFFSNDYPMIIHFSDFASNFSRFSFGMRTFTIIPNTLRCERIDFLPTKISYGVSSCTPLLVHRFMR